MNNHWESHDCYEKYDVGAPDVIKDRNGDIALGLCKHCGRAEAELSEQCDTVTSPHAELITLLKEIRPEFGAVGSRDVDVAAQRHKIDQAIRMLVKRPSAEYVDGVVGDLLEGLGAPEDHEAALAAFRHAGLSEATAYRTLRAVACAEVVPNWHECQRIADLPAVHEMLFDFSQDPTGDNGVMVVRAVLEAVAREESQ